MNLLPLTPSKEALKASVAQSIAQDVSSTQFILIQRHNELMRALWQNPALTQQEVCDGLGTAAGLLFMLGGKTVDFLTDIDPSCLAQLVMPSNAFTVAQDGTVTISTEPYAA